MKATTGIRIPHVFRPALSVACFLLLAPLHSGAQATSSAEQPGQTKKVQDEAAVRRAKAEEQIRVQERQRVLGILPAFNTSNVANAVSLTPKQKFSLAFKSATDPATVAISAVAAGIGQATDSYREYGQGVGGYAKYLGASYADSFDGTMLGNALFPALLHEDPRYFRKGTGSFGSRMWYAVMTTVRCKSDSGKWVPNFGNVLGNLAAGGIANLYYPESDRGVGLTFERAIAVTAEGAFGATLFEFWPDIVHHFRKKKQP